MTAAAVTRHDADDLLDKSYRKTKLGPDVVAWLSWMELGGAASTPKPRPHMKGKRACDE